MSFWQNDKISNNKRLVDIMPIKKEVNDKNINNCKRKGPALVSFTDNILNLCFNTAPHMLQPEKRYKKNCIRSATSFNF